MLQDCEDRIRAVDHVEVGGGVTDEPLVALKSRPEQNSLDDGYMMDGWMVDERLYVAIWWMVDGGYMVDGWMGRRCYER